MANYVSIRIKPVPLTVASRELTHDLRMADNLPAHIGDTVNAVVWVTGNDNDAGTTITRPRGQIDAQHVRRQLTAEITRKSAAEQAAIRDQLQRGKARGKTVKNYFVEGVLTFSPDAIRDVPQDKADALARQTLERVGAEIGVRSLYIAAHHDEQTLHYHMMWEAIDRTTGRSKARLITRAMCRRLQDIAGEIWAEVGLTRGKPKTDARKYRSVADEHRQAMEDIAAEQKTAAEELAAAKAELERVREELRATRLTMDERRKTDVDELKKIDKQRATLRAEQRQIKEAIAKMNAEKTAKTAEIQEQEKRITANKATLDRINAEQKRREKQRAEVADFLRRLKDGGAAVVQFSRRSGGKWTESPKTTNLTATRNMRGLAESLMQESGEKHVKIYGTPPVFCIDDVSAAKLAQLRQELRTLAIVQTSPDNFQVWVAFRDRAKPLKPNEWRIVNDYLVERYDGDRAANRTGHYYRIPGFIRDDAEFTPHMTADAGTRNAPQELERIIRAHGAQYADRIAAREATEREMMLNIEQTAAPEWFRDKWARYWSQAAKNPDLSLSEVDFRAVWLLLRNTPTEQNRIRYAGYICDILHASGEERRKADDYAERTVAAVMETFDR